MSVFGRIASAFIEIRPDTTNFEDDLSGDVVPAARSVAGTLAGVFGAAVFTDQFRRNVGAASDLNEALSVQADVFGDLQDAARGYAQGSAQAFGLSEASYLEAQAQLGGLLQAFEFTADEALSSSQTLIAVGTDLASAYNRDPADAIAALGSAIRGETEPARALNIVLDDATVRAKAVELGLAGTTAEVDRHAKAQATLALIVAQASNVQGNFARTATDTANAERIAAAAAEDARAAAGAGFQDAYAAATRAVGLLAEGFSALPAPVQTATVGLLGVAAFAKPVSDSVGVVRDLSSSLRDSTGAARGAAAAMGALGTATTIASAAYFAFRSTQADDRERVRDLTAAIAAQGDAIDGTTAFLRAWTAEHDELTPMLNRAGTSLTELVAQLNATDEAWSAYRDETLDAAAAADVGTSEYLTLRLALRELRGEVAEANREIDKQATLTGTAAEQTVGWGVNVDEVNARLAELGFNAQSAAGDTEDLLDETISLSDAYRDLSTAILGPTTALTDIDVLLGRARDATGRLTDGTGELTSSNAEAFDAAQRLVEQFVGLAAEADTAGASFEDVAAKGGQLRAELRRQVDIGAITTSQFALLNEVLDALERERRITVTGDRVQISAGSVRQGSSVVMHSGGTVPGRPGEEVPAVLEAGEEVISADVARALRRETPVTATAAAAAGSVTVNVTGLMDLTSPGAAAAVVDAIDFELRNRGLATVGGLR